MGAVTDPAFGSDFDGDAFRAAIVSTMQMGMANGDQVATFYWEEEYEYEYASDDRTPYDLSATPTEVIQAPKTATIPVAVEFVSRATGGLGGAVGHIENPRVVLTVVDTYISDIAGATGVIFDDAKYMINYMAPTLGLFDVNIYEIHCTAFDEA
jgi:hypothetical protein